MAYQSGDMFVMKIQSGLKFSCQFSISFSSSCRLFWTTAKLKQNLLSLLSRMSCLQGSQQWSVRSLSLRKSQKEQSQLIEQQFELSKCDSVRLSWFRDTNIRSDSDRYTNSFPFYFFYMHTIECFSSHTFIDSPSLTSSRSLSSTKRLFILDQKALTLRSSPKTTKSKILKMPEMLLENRRVYVQLDLRLQSFQGFFLIFLRTLECWYKYNEQADIISRLLESSIADESTDKSQGNLKKDS